MSLIARALDRKTPERGISWQTFPGGTMAPVGGAAIPTADQALANAASWACILVLSDAYARTPFDVVRYQGATRVPVLPTPSIVSSPSAVIDPDVWRFQVGASVHTDGNAFGKVLGYQRGWPTQIEIIDPTTVTDRRVVDGVGRVRVDGSDHDLFPHGDIWHVPGRFIPPGSPFALSPLTYAAKAVGTSLKAEDFSLKFFDSPHPTMIVKVTGDPGDDQAQVVKSKIMRASENREPLILGNAYDPTPWSVDPTETKFIELQQFAVLQACRFWLVPPAMVYAAMSGENVTYANVTQADLHYLKHSLEGLLVRLENRFTATLPSPQVARANRNAILRADPQSRWQLYEVQLRTKTTTVDEVRANEDLAPFGGDYAKPGIPGEPPLIAPPTGAKLG